MAETAAPRQGRVCATLALDQGGHASRACIISHSSASLAAASVPVATDRDAAGHVEQNPDELVDSLSQAMREATGAAAETVRRAGGRLVLDAAGLATQRSTLVCFERDTLAPLSPAISWQDRRNSDWLGGFEHERDRIRRITGLPLSPHYGVGKMRWCLEHLPVVRAAADRGTLQMAPLAAYVTARLTRSPARVDPANASRTLLWDSARRDWSPALLELFGIDRALLPACTSTRAQHGLLSSPLGTVPLCAVTGDQSAIPFAFGSPDPGTIYLNLGTGAFVQRPVSTRPPDPAPLLASVLAADAQQVWYCLEATVNGAGSAIAAFVTEQQAAEDFLWGQLETLPENARLPLYVNGIGGLGSPYWRPEQRSYFTAEASLLERFAAVLESIVFLVAINLDCMRGRADAPRRVIVTGGLSRSDWLCRRLAGVLDLPLLRGALEATSLGIAALAASPTRAGSVVATAPSPRPVGADELPPEVRRELRARRRQFEACLDQDTKRP